MSDYILTDSDELRHYGVKGMKWGVRRKLAKQAKTAAHLERTMDANTSSLKRIERKMAKNKASGKGYKNKELNIKKQQLEKDNQDRKNVRNKLIKDLSEKDIAQGRRALMKAGIISGFVAGAVFAPVGIVGSTAVNERRYKNYGRG